MRVPGPPLAPGLDPNYVFNQVGPIIAIVVVVLVCTAAVRVIFRTPVGEALAERIRQRSARRWGVTGEDPQRVAALEAQLSQLQGQVSELAERLDFAERMRAERRERKLGAGQ
jgi:TolA-binding protein